MPLLLFLFYTRNITKKFCYYTILHIFAQLVNN